MRYVRGGADWRQEVKFSFGAYLKAINVRFGDAVAETYRHEPIDKLLNF